MSAILKEVYDAFIEAGTSEPKAAEAAKAIANDEKQFSEIKTDLLIIKWMVGLVIVVIVLPVLKTLFLS